MKIAKNVEMLEIKGERENLYPVLIWDESDVVLIDTALPGQTELLGEAVKQAGYSLGQITKVILTHQDLDHVGSAKTLANMGAKIYAHKQEAPYIQGDVTSIRLSDMESRLNELDEDERAFYEQAKIGAPYFYVNVDNNLKDGDILDICGGIKIIYTPGHTPGHIAVLLMQSDILVAGDAANIADNKLTGADPDYTRDAMQAEESFQKITALKPSSVVCYHGGLYTY